MKNIYEQLSNFVEKIYKVILEKIKKNYFIDATKYLNQLHDLILEINESGKLTNVEKDEMNQRFKDILINLENFYSKNNYISSEFINTLNNIKK